MEDIDSKIDELNNHITSLWASLNSVERELTENTKRIDKIFEKVITTHTMMEDFKEQFTNRLDGLRQWLNKLDTRLWFMIVGILGLATTFFLEYFAK
jgi:uncharacterized coiled-coil DUF342 family protein